MIRRPPRSTLFLYTTLFRSGVFVIASGRAPERPIFVVRPGARGDVTLASGKTSNDAVTWSRTGRGSYMPTPLIYRGQLYVLANNGVVGAYNLRTGDEISRGRVPGGGHSFSPSPLAPAGNIYPSHGAATRPWRPAGPSST